MVGRELERNPSHYYHISKQQSPDIKQASLSIAHQEEPDDLIILNHLIESHIKTYEFDKAMLMADRLIELANLQENVQYHGNGLLNQSEILLSYRVSRIIHIYHLSNRFEHHIGNLFRRK